jgi:3'-phosphoadenosine 5'-phosphosulfate sulfotransferase (PAPS reductase)/FAD synthetase
MRHEDREMGRLRAKLAVYQRRVDQSRTIISKALRMASDEDHPLFVSYSCGEDSAVMLDLVREQAPDIECRILLWPESEVVGNFGEVIAAV